MYQKADYVITPSGILKSDSVLRVTTPIIAVSNGIDLKNTGKDPRRRSFRELLWYQEGQPVVVVRVLPLSARN